MLSFVTPTLLPLQAALTMGISAKPSDSIGRFGTGLKYAIAGILRLGGHITLYIGLERHHFTTQSCVVRDKEFHIVHCNDVPCGFTTELGKHWEPWQLFRELASNTLDEGGEWSHMQQHPSLDSTLIVVQCEEVENAEETEKVFMAETPVLMHSRSGAKIHQGACPYYYYRGIRAGKFPCESPVTVNVPGGRLSEDRMLDLSQVQAFILATFSTATAFDASMMYSAASSNSPSDFWQHALPIYASFAEPAESVLAFLDERGKIVEHPTMLAWLRTYREKQRGGAWQELPWSPEFDAMLAQGEALVAAVGIDVVPRSKVHLTRDLPDETLAVTRMDTRDVWFSTNSTLRGRDEWLSTYLEEATHAMTGHADCTRAMQNVLFSIVVKLGLAKLPC